MFSRTSTTEAPQTFSAVSEDGRTAAVSILPGVPLPAGLVEPPAPVEPMASVELTAPVEPAPVEPAPVEPAPVEAAIDPIEAEVAMTPAMAQVVDYGPPPVVEVVDYGPSPVVEVVASPADLVAEPTAPVLPDVPLPATLSVNPAAVEPETVAPEPAPVTPASTAVMVDDNAPARRSFFGARRRRPAARTESIDAAPVPVPAHGGPAEAPTPPAFAEAIAPPAYVGAGVASSSAGSSYEASSYGASSYEASAYAPSAPVAAPAAPAVLADPAEPDWQLPPAPPAYAATTEASIPAFAHLSPPQQVSFPDAMAAANAEAAAARSVGLVYADGSHTELAAGPDAAALQHVANVLAGEPGPAYTGTGTTAETAPNE